MSLNLLAGPAVAGAGSAPHRRRQCRADDRPRHQHLPAGRCARSRCSIRDPTIADHLQSYSGGGRHRDPLDHRDPYASRSFAARAPSSRGAPVRASSDCRRPATAGRTRAFTPEHTPARRRTLSLGEVALIAIHTPGHASNCVCYLLGARAAAVHRRSRARRRVTGDFAARRRYGGVPALSREARCLRLRAHCAGTRRPHGARQEVIEALRAHRLAREDKVLRSLATAGAADAR